MDQHAFRKLLTSSRQPQPNIRLGVPATANGAPQRIATTALSEPAFKPRKVKKNDGKYRDRAAERREGAVNEYAQIEAVLEDFEQRAAHEDKDDIEQQRKYLGGDSQHTILVKGLDMSLLEQNRARAVASVEDDEVLEQAFAEANSTSEPTEPKKRTREDIIRNLKAKRQNEDTLTSQLEIEKSNDKDKLVLDAAKKAGKFKPIGFKPIGQIEEKPKKRKVKEEKVGVKKRQKVDTDSIQPVMETELIEETSVSQGSDTAGPSSSKIPKKPSRPEQAPLSEDFDIFADAGEYQPFPDDEESEEHRDTKEAMAGSVTQDAVSPIPASGSKGWFDDTERDVRETDIPPEKSPPISETRTTEEEAQEMRLKPLQSSALPSIRDFLAMDRAAEKTEKRKARKEKKKKKKAVNDDEDD